MCFNGYDVSLQVKLLAMEHNFDMVRKVLLQMDVCVAEAEIVFCYQNYW